MKRCLYNGLEHQEIRTFLKENKMSNCLNCEYKYPCTNYKEFSPEGLFALEEKINLERRIMEDKIIRAHLKSGYYRTANP
jgi:hypothetical protein